MRRRAAVPPEAPAPSLLQPALLLHTCPPYPAHHPQFVQAQSSPASSYLMPTQQLLITTYALLATLALESIIVFRIATWKQSCNAAAARCAARDRYRAAAAAAAAATAAVEASSRCSGRSSLDDSLPTKAPPSPSTPSTGGRGAMSAAAEAAAAAAVAQVDADLAAAAGHGGGGGSGSGARRRPQLRRLESLSVDADYDAFVAYRVDCIALVVLWLAYVLCVVLIFALQSGFITTL